jgi:methyl-accepting chemotaxis protein
MNEDARGSRGLLDRHVVRFIVLFLLAGGVAAGAAFTGNQVLGLAAGLGLTGLFGIALTWQTDRAITRIGTEVDPVANSGGPVGLGQLPGVINEAVADTQRLRQRLSNLESEREELEQKIAEHKEQSQRQAEQLEEFRAAMRQCAAGELETRLEEVDELDDDIASDFNEMMDELEETVQHLKEFVGLVVRSSSNVTEGTEEVERASEQITDTIQQISMGA